MSDLTVDSPKPASDRPGGSASDRAVDPAVDQAMHPAVDPTPRLIATGRRSRKKQQTRDRLVAAADELFRDRGYEATTTLDIAEAADVAQRTLFRHFPSKEALLYADMEAARLELRAALRRAASEIARDADRPAPLELVTRAVLALEENFATNRDRRMLQARLAATSPAVSGYFRAVVQAGWERELISAVASELRVDPLDDPRPEILAGAVMSALRAATRQWTASNGTHDYLQLLADALAAIPASVGDRAR